ncbi:cysteine hydrolase [Niveibacterium sp. SC-1]|uniref:cysteine hydrolase n=1 Tax=Niveibacterium sp. SC-1 TaxID=3135646 RepID=UPI00311E5F0A
MSPQQALKVQLLVIDPQNDFCDLPEGWLPPDPLHADARTQSGIQPALPVAGAHADMQRLAGFVREAGAALDAITLTLDSHHRVGIERPTFWRKGDGGAVDPFTTITAADVRTGRFAPRHPAHRERVLAYLDTLEAAGRYTLMVWPVHCEIGTWGYAVHAGLQAAYNEWEVARGTQVHKVLKGSNPWTEHYSALMAEVPDPADPHTQLNRALVGRLAAADLLIVAGEAGSHCVKATVEHYVQQVPAALASRIVLLTDCISPVGGFEAQYRKFLDDMRARGVRVASSQEIRAELRARAA